MIQLSPPKKIPYTVLPFPEDYLQQRTQTKCNLPTLRTSSNYYNGPSSRATEAVLLKYYPKYCRSLHFDKTQKPQSLLLRIKQIKILENIEYSHGYKEKKSVIKLMKQLFINKRKSVKSLPLVKFEQSNGFLMIETSTITEMCFFFPKIQNLKIFKSPSFARKPENILATRSLEKKMLRFYGYFWDSLRSLQHLELSNESYNLWVILPWLNSSKRFLTSLKTFSLGVDIYFMPGQRNSPRASFQILLKNQDLLKYVTNLKFSGIQIFHNYGTQVKSVLDCCTNLVCLSFPIESEFNRADRRHLTLAPLQSFQNIRILTVNVNDAWSFFEVFGFPQSLQKLVLHLENRFCWFRIWRALFPEAEGDPLNEVTIRIYENYRILLNFFEKFKQLSLLTSLHLSLPLFVHSDELMNNFILPIIRAIPKLENFECQFSWANQEIKNNFDLSLFLDGIAPLEHLKSFKISQRFWGEQSSIKSGDLVMAFNPLKSYSFPHITSVYIDNWISEDFNFKKFFKMFSVGIKEVTLSKIYLGSINSFIHLLETLRHADQLSAARITIGIVLPCEYLADLEQLSSNLILAKNVSIKANIYLPSSRLHTLSQRTFQNPLSSFQMKIITL